MIRNEVTWTSVDYECPSNERPVTVVVRTSKGSHTMGAYYDKEKEEWYETYSDIEISNIVTCWADIELPEEYLF